LKTAIAVIAAFLVISLTAEAQPRTDNPLTIKVLKAERSGNVSYLLFSVENTSDQRFEHTTWSCVFFDNGEPAHEERSTIRNVPPRERAIARIIQNYGGPFDKIEYRFMNSQPSRCP
jgi:hypothetical protein